MSGGSAEADTEKADVRTDRWGSRPGASVIGPDGEEAGAGREKTVLQLARERILLLEGAADSP